ARIQADQAVVTHAGRIPARRDGPDEGLLEEVLADAHGEQVLGGERAFVKRRATRMDIQKADVQACLAAGDLEAEKDRHLLPVQQPDGAAEEGDQIRVLAPEPGHIEDTGALQEEGPLLGKEQLEACQVDLPGIDLCLGKVRVDGERGRHARSDALEDVQPGLELAAVVLLATRDEGTDVETAPLLQAGESRELPRGSEVADPGVLPRTRPPVVLLEPLELPFHVEAPDRLTG